MNFPFYIARRYLFSKKSHNAINIISMVSVCGVVVATMALVCALSVLNGFVGLVSSMLGNFDPELKIQPVHGKVFDPTLPAVREVKELPEVALFCEVLQDNAQVRYRDRQITATVKGVDDTFGRLTRIDSILVDSREGSFVLSDEVANYANLGVGTAFSLGVRPNYADPLEIYAPKRNEKVNLANPVASLNLEYAFVGGVYATNQQMYDENFVLLPLPMVRSLFDYEKEVSAIELSLVPGADINSVKSRIKSLLGDDFSVKDRYEQQEASFRMMQGEKWMIFLILCFILILALFNVIAFHADDRKERGCPYVAEYGCGRPSDSSYFPFRGLDDFRARRFDRYRYRIGPLFVATGVGYYQIRSGSRLLYYRCLSGPCRSR